MGPSPFSSRTGLLLRLVLKGVPLVKEPMTLRGKNAHRVLDSFLISVGVAVNPCFLGVKNEMGRVGCLVLNITFGCRGLHDA